MISPPPPYERKESNKKNQSSAVKGSKQRSRPPSAVHEIPGGDSALRSNTAGGSSPGVTRCRGGAPCPLQRPRRVAAPAGNGRPAAVVVPVGEPMQARAAAAVVAEDGRTTTPAFP